MWYPSAGWTSGCWWCGIRVQAELVVQPALGYHIINSQSRYITPTRLKSAQYNLHNNAASSRKLLKMDVLTSETCWAVNWHNKTSVIKLVYLYSNIKMMHIPIRIRLTKAATFPYTKRNKPSAYFQFMSIYRYLHGIVMYVCNDHISL